MTLKPCPIDGGLAVWKEHPYRGTGASGMEAPDLSIRCTLCGLETTREKTEKWERGKGTYSIRAEAEQKLAERWNTRTLPLDGDVVERVRDSLGKTEAALDNGLTPHELDELTTAAITATRSGDGELRDLRAEVKRLQAQLDATRAKSKSRGLDLLRDEADAAHPHFRATWEPLKTVAERAGVKSAAWLAHRARNLEERGLVESKWIGQDRTQFKLWRLKGRPVPIHASGHHPVIEAAALSSIRDR